VKKNKFSIITPTKNSERYIIETINSVLNQTAVKSNRVELEYIICDGKSTDKTIEIINSFIHSKKSKNIEIRLLSEEDNGMYDAIAKGLKASTGNYCSYINSDDFYSLSAFDVILDIFEQYNYKWITGINTSYNEMSQVVGFLLPFKYRKRFIECGFYGTKLPFIQQESTFWHSSLNDLLDYNEFSKFQYAGDFYLWKTFSKVNKLIIINCYLSGFRIHSTQLSSVINNYMNEFVQLSRKPNLLDYFIFIFDLLIWNSPNRIKKILNNKELLKYNHEKKMWI
jgi:glycosyltransferase involved in cell wall biosynthesis